MTHKLVAFTLAALVFTATGYAVTIGLVPVGNPDNAHDPATGNEYGNLYGGVSYAYNLASMK